MAPVDQFNRYLTIIDGYRLVSIGIDFCHVWPVNQGHGASGWPHPALDGVVGPVDPTRR